MDPVSVCNMSVGLLGDLGKTKRMTAFSVAGCGGSLPLITALDFYQEAQDRMLAAQEWSRTTKTVALSVSTEDPLLDGKWTYKYTRPPDALIIRAVLDDTGTEYEWDDMAEQRIAGGQTFNDEYIYANVEDALCKYTFRVGPDRYLPGMGLLHARYLAESICMSVTAKVADAVLLSREIERRYERLCKALGAKEGYVAEERGDEKLLVDFF